MSDYARLHNKMGEVAVELKKLAGESPALATRLNFLAQVLERRTPAMDDVVGLPEKMEQLKAAKKERKPRTNPRTSKKSA